MNQDTQNTKQKMTPKRIAAIVCIVLLAALYVVTLLAAIFGAPGLKGLFGLCLLGTFTIPLITWVYIWMYGKLSGKRTIADFELDKDNSDGK